MYFYTAKNDNFFRLIQKNKKQTFKIKTPMKNTFKLFSLVMVSIVLFSCSTDEQDADLERAIKMSENMQQLQAREGEEIIKTDSIAREDGTPVIVVKKD